jgi:hypothetical protein
MAWDKASESLVLFGGFRGGAALGDTWQLKGRVWTRVAVDGPSGRSNYSMTAAGSAGIILFGGWSPNPDSYYNDTWQWTRGAWTRRPATGAQPIAREMAGIAYDAVNNVVVLHGGRTAEGMTLSDTWHWNDAWQLARP